MSRMLHIEQARVLITVAVGLAVTVGIWLMAVAASGFVWP